MNYFKLCQDQIRTRLALMLDSLHPVLKADMIVVFQAPGKLLGPPSHNSPSGVWALLPFLIAKSTDPMIDEYYVSSIALALECVICALDLLDDIEDGDRNFVVEALGSARVLNLSTALLAAGQQLLCSHLVPSQRGDFLFHVLSEALLNATAGQHRDLQSEHQSIDEFTLQDCIEIAEGKAGMLMQLACRFGVGCAETDEKIIELWSGFGRFFGIAHQFLNDCRDLETELNSVPGGSPKSDLLRNKKTLPILCAPAQLTSPSFSDDSRRGAFHEGIVIARGISQVYYQLAYDELGKIHAICPLSSDLRSLLQFNR